MNLRYITCSDPREHLPVPDVISLLKMSPLVEIGIQTSSGTMSQSKPRKLWFDVLMFHVVNNPHPLNVALHINYDWCDDLCSGKIPYELGTWLKMRNRRTDGPAIRRWQLNIGDRTQNFDAASVARLIRSHPEQEFILPYNDKVKSKIEFLYKTGEKFSLLYDSSYGYGVSPENWNAPVYITHPMGYAGGLSPENVSENLNKISAVTPRDYSTWIDAEGRLMKPGTRQFDIDRARQYVRNALAWQEAQNKR